jgi:UDP-N-acetylglucosamine diphosphorylase/glucosamine-1-phosphate N-acetyltransferase
MAISLFLYEDDGYRKLLPLAHTRPVYALRCGTTSLAEKIIRCYPDAGVGFHCRPLLAGVVRNGHPSSPVNELPEKTCLLINGRLLADKSLAEKIPPQGPDCLYTCGETLVAARLSGQNLAGLAGKIAAGPLSAGQLAVDRTEEVEVTLIDYSWELVHHNGAQIEADWNFFGHGGQIRGQVYDGVNMINADGIFIDEGAKVKPGAVLDAEGGPIIIRPGATVFPNAVIEGPAFVGQKSLIKIGAKIYEGTTIGEVCKVGGEVEESIIHSYSNKQHDGFLGHAYLGMWVNLGADTNNSDLKNNYGNVKVHVDGQMVDSGSMFVGLTMGDHSKSGINTMFNTGTVVGVCCNVYGGGFPPKYIPSFSWGGARGIEDHRFEKAVGTARAVMGRRKVKLTPDDENVLRAIFDETAEERAILRSALGSDLH